MLSSQYDEALSNFKSQRYDQYTEFILPCQPDDMAPTSGSTPHALDFDSEKQRIREELSQVLAQHAQRFDWNAAFQSNVEALQVALSRRSKRSTTSEVECYKRLANLAHDFAYMAQLYGKIIICERHLPDSEKTVKSIKLDGVAGGSKYLVHGILFKFGDTSKDLYDNNTDNAAKASKLDLMGCAAMFAANVQALTEDIKEEAGEEVDNSLPPIAEDSSSPRPGRIEPPDAPPPPHAVVMEEGKRSASSPAPAPAPSSFDSNTPTEPSSSVREALASAASSGTTATMHMTPRDSVKQQLANGFRSIHVPLMAVICYRGFRLTAMSVLPVDHSTLVHGCSDGRYVVSRDAEFTASLRWIATVLNVKEHIVKDTLLLGPFDCEGHRSHKDGRFYMLDFSRLFPCEALTTESPKGAHLFRMLRPELVQRNAVPLSSDAFSVMGMHGANEHNCEVWDATQRLYSQIIPEFARWLVTQTDYDWQHYPPDDSFAVTVLMHRFGINVRHLFYVYLSLEDIATPPTSAISDNEAKEESPTDRDRVSSPPTSPAAPSADSRVVHFAVSDATASSLGPPQSATSPAQLEPAPSPVSPTSDGRVPTPASRKSAIRSARAEYLSSGAHEAPPTATAPPVASKKTASNLSQPTPTPSQSKAATGWMSNVLVEMIARTIKCLINTQFRAISDLVRDQLSASASRSGVDKNSSGKGVSTAESTGPVVSLQSSDEPYRAVTLAALNKYAQVVPQDRERASWSDVDKDGKRDRELLQHWTKLREDIQAKFASPSTADRFLAAKALLPNSMYRHVDRRGLFMRLSKMLGLFFTPSVWASRTCLVPASHVGSSERRSHVQRHTAHARSGGDTTKSKQGVVSSHTSSSGASVCWNEAAFSSPLGSVDLVDIQGVTTDLNIVSFAEGKMLQLQAWEQLGSRSTELLQLAIARFTKAHDAGGAVFMSHNLADACMDMALRQDSPVLARKYMALARTVLFSRRSSTSGSVPHISSQQRRVEDSATSQALMKLALCWTFFSHVRSRTIPQNADRIYGVALSRKAVIAGSTRGALLVYHRTSLERMDTIMAHISWIRCMRINRPLGLLFSGADFNDCCVGISRVDKDATDSSYYFSAFGRAASKVVVRPTCSSLDVPVPALTTANTPYQGSRAPVCDPIYVAQITMGLWGELKDIPLEMRSQRFGQKQQVETWTRRIPVGAVSKHPDDKVLCVDLITPSVISRPRKLLAGLNSGLLSVWEVKGELFSSCTDAEQLGQPGPSAFSPLTSQSPAEPSRSTTGSTGNQQQSNKVVGKSIRFLAGHRGSIWSACVLDHDLELVATGAQDHTIRIWDLSRLSTRKQEHVWPNSKFGSMSVRHWIDSLAPEDKSFCVATLGAVGNRDPHVGHTGWVQAIVRTSNGFASASFDRTIRLWRVLAADSTVSRSDLSARESDEEKTPLSSSNGSSATVECFHILRGHLDGIWCLRWVPIVNVLVSGSSDTTIRIWSLDPAVLSCVKILEGHSSDVYSLDADVEFWTTAPARTSSSAGSSRASAATSTSKPKPLSNTEISVSPPRIQRWVTPEPGQVVAVADATDCESGAPVDSDLPQRDAASLETACESQPRSCARLTVVSGSADESVRVWTLDSTSAALAHLRTVTDGSEGQERCNIQ